MKKHDQPYMPFYFGDWFKAPEIRALSPAARCLWFEMLGLMWESTERGYLTLAGKPISNETLGRMLGFAGVLLDGLLTEMEQFSVFSKRDDGAIYNRRMVRDAEISSVRAIAGKKGGFCSSKRGSKKEAKGIANADIDIEGDIDIETVKQVIVYLNEKLGTHYKIGAASNVKNIKARLSEGHSVDDCKKVIDNKIADWKDDEKMAKFLRPETLFGSKFQGYLNQKKVEDTHERYERMHRENQAIIAAARNARGGSGRDNQILVGCGPELAGAPDRQESDFECPGME